MLWLWIVLVVLFLSFIVLTLLLKLRQPLCGGNIDPSKRVCDSKGSIVTGESCQKVGTGVFTNDFLSFFRYLQEQRTKPSPDYNQLTTLRADWKTYRGIFFFAIPELLRILPTDFGQNNSTPYGIVSFYPSYWPCIGNTSALCSNLFSSMDTDSNAWQVLCNLYAKQEQRGKTCPFVVRDNNKDIYIQDPAFFNDVGLLGAISLYFHQAIVMFVDLPVETLKLDYWSLDVYLADRLDRDDVCYPPRQAYMASLLPPLNMYKAVAVSHKNFDPLRADSNTVVKGHVRFYVILALEQHIQDQVETFLREHSTRSYDFIYTFQIPTADSTMPINDTLPNPNQLSHKSALFQPQTDRLCCFMRLSPDPNHGDPTALRDFIYQNNYQDSFEVNLVEMNTPSYNLYGAPQWPLRIDPPKPETSLLSQQWGDLQRSLLRALPAYSFLKLQVRNSIFNIMAPLYQDLLTTTTHQYEGGFQAIQLAGNAQADNYDANYVISEGVCLLEKDVLVAVAVNHASLGNCIYNSINVVDINRAFGYDAINLTRENRVDFYVTIIGRDHETITNMKKEWQDRLSQYKIGFYMIHISNADLPVCHQILAIERVYVNTQFPSQSGNVLYSLLDPQEQEDWWNSLANVTAPNPKSMIKPIFYKVSPIHPQQRLNLIYTLLSLVVVVAVILRYVIYAS